MMQTQYMFALTLAKSDNSYQIIVAIHVPINVKLAKIQRMNASIVVLVLKGHLIAHALHRHTWKQCRLSRVVKVATKSVQVVRTTSTIAHPALRKPETLGWTAVAREGTSKMLMGSASRACRNAILARTISAAMNVSRWGKAVIAHAWSGTLIRRAHVFLATTSAWLALNLLVTVILAKGIVLLHLGARALISRLITASITIALRYPITAVLPKGIHPIAWHAPTSCVSMPQSAVAKTVTSTSLNWWAALSAGPSASHALKTSTLAWSAPWTESKRPFASASMVTWLTLTPSSVCSVPISVQRVSGIARPAMSVLAIEPSHLTATASPMSCSSKMWSTVNHASLDVPAAKRQPLIAQSAPISEWTRHFALVLMGTTKNQMWLNV